MKANPGGLVDPKNVVGRESLKSEIWRVLDCQSLILEAERRMGKTCLIRLLGQSCPAGYKSYWWDLEDVTSPKDFTLRIFSRVSKDLPWKAWCWLNFKRLVSNVSGLKAGGVALPKIDAVEWKALLRELLAALTTDENPRTLFMFDEIPLMLRNISKAHSPSLAEEVLNVLRGVRQSKSGIRMIFAGSVGLHHVIASIREQGSNSPMVNDMDTIAVPPLPRLFAIELAKRLIEGEGLLHKINKSHEEDLAAELVARGEQIPYFIHHLVRDLSRARQPTIESIPGLIDSAIADTSDRWYLNDYFTRLIFEDYYPPDRLEAIIATLDFVSSGETEEWSEISKIHLELITKGFVATNDEVDEVIELLTRDRFLRISDDRKSAGFQIHILSRKWAHNGSREAKRKAKRNAAGKERRGQGE